MSIIEINSVNIHYLNVFLNNHIPLSFRYFNNKTVSDIVKNHFKTFMYIENDIPLGYAHIDYDIVNDKYWFGICVLTDHHKKGIGKRLITTVINHFENANFESLYLTVDKTNNIAYNLYLKFGFKVLRETSSIYIMSLNKSKILYLPVSFGEAIDKLSILDIKKDKITDSRKYDVEKEYKMLYNQLEIFTKNVPFYYNALKQINLQIWDDQDKFRYSTNDDEKTTICKKIIEDNDARFRIKDKINNILSSSLKEQKGYLPKQFIITYSSNTKYHSFINSIIKYQLIFNDKVKVLCKPEYVDNLNSLFSNDNSIEISSTLDEPTDEYINNLQDTINNKRFFEFVQAD